MLSDETLENIKTLIDGDQVEALKNVLSTYVGDDIAEGHIFGDQTIFMYACQHGSPEAVKCFIDKDVGFYEIQYGDTTEFKCAAQNKNHAFSILSMLLASMDKDFAKELLESNGDSYFELEGEGDGKTPVDILKEKNDSKSLELVKGYLS